MRKFNVQIFYENIIRENWEVEAETEDVAKEKAYKGEGEFQGDKVISGELLYGETEIEEVK